MQQINCNETTCEYNKAHPSGKGRTCNIDKLSIFNGTCEYWFVRSEHAKLEAQKTLEAIHKTKCDPSYNDAMQDNREARGN
jgi:hypothetical protein